MKKITFTVIVLLGITLSAFSQISVTRKLSLRVDTTIISDSYATNIYQGNWKKFKIPTEVKRNHSLIKELVLGVDTFYILHGKGSKQEAVVIIDTDRNFDFTNNFTYRFGANKNQADQELPVETIVLKNKDRTGKQIVYIRPQRGIPNKTDVKLKPKLTEWNDLNIELSLYSTGEFDFDNRSFLFVMRDEPGSASDHFHYTVVPKESIVPFTPNQKNLVLYRDSFKVDKYRFKPRFAAHGKSRVNLDIIDWEKLLASRTEGILEGSSAPRFRTEDINGKRVHSNQYAGKYLLIDFWGTWCTPCIETLPQLTALHKRHPELEILSVAFELEEKSIRRIPDFIREYEMNWTHLYELMQMKGEFLSVLFKVSKFPTSILIDPNGVIIFRGSLKDRDNKLEQILTDVYAQMDD